MGSLPAFSRCFLGNGGQVSDSKFLLLSPRGLNAMVCWRFRRSAGSPPSHYPECKRFARTESGKQSGMLPVLSFRIFAQRPDSAAIMADERFDSIAASKLPHEASNNQGGRGHPGK